MKPRSVLLFVAAALVLAGAVTSHWTGVRVTDYDAYGTPDATSFDMHLGLLRYSQCSDGRCDAGFLLGGSGFGIQAPLGLVVFASAVTLALFSVWTGVTSLRDRRGPASALLGIAGGATFFALVFKLTLGGSQGTWGYSTALYFAGAAMAFAGALYAQKGLVMPGRPVMVMTPYGYAMPARPMACDLCGGPTMFVPQYGKLFCAPCNRYLV